MKSGLICSSILSEMWMREQQSQYKDMLKEKERMGRIRKKKSQVSVFSESIEEQINPDFMDDEVKDFLGSYTPDTRPPLHRKRRKWRKSVRADMKNPPIRIMTMPFKVLKS